MVVLAAPARRLFPRKRQLTERACVAVASPTRICFPGSCVELSRWFLSV